MQFVMSCVYPAVATTEQSMTNFKLVDGVVKPYNDTSEIVSINPSDITWVSDRDYPLGFDKDNTVMRRGSLPHQFWVLISERGETANMDPYTGLPVETIEMAFARTARAYDEEMECSCEYVALMDKLDHFDANHPLCAKLNHMKLTMDIEAAFMNALDAKAFRKQREIVSTTAQRDRVDRLTQAVNIQSKLFQEQQSSYDGNSAYPWTPSADLMKVIRDEINELLEGVQLSGWYVAMSYMMYRTGRPFFSPVELPRESSSLPVAYDPLWKCPFGLSSRKRWALFATDSEYASSR